MRSPRSARENTIKPPTNVITASRTTSPSTTISQILIAVPMPRRKSATGMSTRKGLKYMVTARTWSRKRYESRITRNFERPERGE